MKRWILGVLVVALAAVGCGSEPAPHSKPVIITKKVGDTRVTFAMLDGAEGKKVFVPMTGAVQCTPEGCTPCEGENCILNGGCPCSNKGCSPLCNPDVTLPGDETSLKALLAPPSVDAIDSTEACSKRISELEARIRELEASH